MTTEYQIDAALSLRRLVRRGAPAGDVLVALRRVVPYEQVLLSRWLPREGRHVHLAGNAGPRMARFIAQDLAADPFFVDRCMDPESTWLTDMAECDAERSLTVKELIRPEGIMEGLTRPLYSPPGVYIGVLNFCWYSVVRVDRECRDLVDLIYSDLGVLVTREVERLSGLATPLTARESEVLEELRRGRTNGEIAELWGISSRTVSTHVERILRKLGVPNRTAAATFGNDVRRMADDAWRRSS